MEVILIIPLIYIINIYHINKFFLYFFLHFALVELSKRLFDKINTNYSNYLFINLSICSLSVSGNLLSDKFNILNYGF